MAVASVRAVVWEWQRDDGGYSPYYPEVIQAIESARKNGDNTLNLGTASKVLAPYMVDLSNNTQTRTGTGMVRNIRRSEMYVSGTPCHALWEWQDGSNNFNIYSVTAIFEIEEAYNLKQISVDLSTKPSRLPYTIDFTTFYQTRHYYNTRRKIKRTQLSHSLQSYLAVSTASASLTSGTRGSELSGSLMHNGLSVAPSSHSLPGGTPLPGIHPPLTGSITPSSSSATVSNFNSSVPKVKPSLRSGTASTSSTHASYSPSKGESTKKPSPSVASRSSGRARNKSAPTKAVDLTSSVTGKSAKRCRTKAVKPVKKDLIFSPGMPYLRKVSRVKKKDDGPCPICMSELSEESGYGEGSGENSGVYKLTKCGHMLHTPCVKAYIENSSISKGNFQCPTCKKIYGIKTGDMPPGSMKVLHQMGSLPGHEGYGTIQITYSFHPGIHMGKRYSTNGFPRTCYLPDSPKGQKVLKLLRKAWDRKLTFTIGTSVTTGAANTIVWNEIHHKTESTSNYSGHGYPDPNYLDNVTAELAAQGVEDSADEGDDNDASESGSSSDSDQ